MITMAEDELARLKNTQAFSPVAAVTGRMEFKSGIRYIFEDKSRLYIYFDGGATCERNISDVIQFHKNWHQVKA